jgi:phage-related protein
MKLCEELRAWHAAMLHRRVYVVAANYMFFLLHVSTSNENAWRSP